MWNGKGWYGFIGTISTSTTGISPPVSLHRWTQDIWIFGKGVYMYEGLGVGFADLTSFFFNILWKWNNLVSLRPNYFIFIGYLKTGGREGVRANLLNPLWIRHCYRWSIDGFPFKEEGALTLSDFIAGWRDIDQTMPRSEGKLKILEELFTQVKQLRPADASVIKGLYYIFMP